MSPVARRFRLPRHLRVPFAGRAFLLVTLGVGVAAVNTGNNLLYLALSLNLSLILLSGVLSEGTLRHVTLSVRLASEAFAGGEAFLAVTCSAEAKRFPGISLVANLRAGKDPCDGPLPGHRPRHVLHPRCSVPTCPKGRTRFDRRLGFDAVPVLPLREIGRACRSRRRHRVPPAHSLRGAVRGPPGRGAVGTPVPVRSGRGLPPGSAGAPSRGPRAGHPLEDDGADGTLDGQGAGRGSHARDRPSRGRERHAGGVRSSDFGSVRRRARARAAGRPVPTPDRRPRFAPKRTIRIGGRRPSRPWRKRGSPLPPRPRR